jgi:xanthosine phosphorylase
MSLDPAAAIETIRAKAPGFTPRVAIILGSGLGGLADQIENPIVIPYAEIPGFPRSTVAGHSGELVLGTLGGVAIAGFKGRKHVYEGEGLAGMAVPIRAMKGLGAELLIVTNAAGSLRLDLEPGKLMLMADHINLMNGNPLIGPNDETIGPRFPPMANAYDAATRAKIRATAEKLGIPLQEGTYIAVTGPCFETPAEIRAFQRLGADAVGMSTVPEVILARHCGLTVAGVSAITNLGEGLSDTALSHAHTLALAGQAGKDLTRLVIAFLEDFGT